MTLLLFHAGPTNVSPGPTTRPVDGRRRVEVAFPNGPYDSAPVFTEVSWALRDEATPIKMSRGRQNELQEYDAGDFSCILDNRDRKFEPEFAPGPYYPNIQPEKKIRYTLEYPWLPGLIVTPTFERTTPVTSAGLPLLFTHVTTPSTAEWQPSSMHTPNCTLVVQPGAGYMRTLSGVQYPSLRMTATASGDAWFDNGYYYPVMPGVGYATSFRAKGVTTGRTLELHMQWFSNSLSLLRDDVTTYNIVGQTEVATGYTRFGAQAVAPVAAAFLYLSYRVWTAGAGEQHDFDCFVLQDHASFQGIFPRCVTFADSWLPTYDTASSDSYMTLTSHDGFKLLGGKDMTDVGYKGLVESYSPSHYYRLGDPLNSPTAADEENPLTPGIASGGLIFGVAGGLLADINTAANFSAGWIDCGTAPAWLGTTANSVTLMWLATGVADRMMQQGPYTAGASSADNFWNLYTQTGPDTLQFSAEAGFGNTVVFTVPVAYDGKYHLLTLQRQADGVTYDVFQDGVRLVPTAVVGCTVNGSNQVVASVALNFNSNRVLLGGANDGPSFTTGDLDEVFFINGGVITLAQHQALWNLMTTAWASQTSGQRIAAVLDLMGWPSLDRNIDPGNQVLPAQIDPLAGPSLSTNTLDYLKTVEKSEGGQLFMGNDGRIRFIARQAQYKPPYTTVQAVFGDRPGTIDTATGLPELPYQGPQPDFGDANLYTEAQVTRAIPGGGSGVTQWAHDDTITNNPKKTASRSGLFLEDDDEAWQYANWLFRSFSIAKYMFRKIVINPLQNDALWYQVCMREIGDRIVVIKRPSGWTSGAPLIRVECIISKIEETGKRGEAQFTWQLGAISSLDYLVLDDPKYGLLDSNNYLGY